MTFFITYNLLPLMIVVIPFYCLYKYTSVPPKRILLIIIIIAAAINLRHFFLFGACTGFDSQEFIGYGQEFASGNGLTGVIYRTPLYPFICGLFFSLFSYPLSALVIFNHLLIILSIIIVWKLALSTGFSLTCATFAAVFFLLNSLVLNMAQYIMSDLLFMFLLLISLLSAVLFIKQAPSMKMALITAILFALTLHCRQLSAPFAYTTILISFLRAFQNRCKKRFLVTAVFALVYFVSIVPWSLHNYKTHGYYGLSSHFGANIFTKLTSYNLQDTTSPTMQKIRPVYDNVLFDLGLTGYETPEYPESDWTINIIPHTLTDSLTINHGMQYHEASDLLKRASFEGFAADPSAYLNSVAKTFFSLLFKHHELYPSPKRVWPQSLSPALLPASFFRGFFYLPGHFIFLFIPLFLFYKKKSFYMLIPFTAIGTGYLMTSLVQTGFTRYTIPWIPYWAILAGFCIDKGIDTGTIIIRKFKPHIKNHLSKPGTLVRKSASKQDTP